MTTKPEWSELVEEINRQIEAVPQHIIPPSKDPRKRDVIYLDEQGEEYRLQLKQLRDKILASLSRTTENNLCDVAIDQNLAWKISAFRESSWTEVPDQVKTQMKDMISLREDRTENRTIEFWKSPQVIEWASKDDCSLLILQGNSVYLNVIEKASVDLVDYLECNNRQVFWMFGAPVGRFTRSYYQNTIGETTRRLLRNIVVQIVKGHPGFGSLKRLATLVGLMRSASSADEWFEILGFVLEGLNEAYIVVDMGVVGADLQLMVSWPTSLARLFRTLRERSPKAVLKVFLTVCRALPKETDLSEAVVVRVNFPIVTRPKLPGNHMSQIQLPLLQVPPESAVRPESTIQPKLAAEAKPSTTELDKLEVQQRLVIEEEPTKTSKSSKRPKDWFYEMKAFEKSVDACRKEPDEASPRVRIAILDTGVDLSHPDMTAIYGDGRLQYYDFVDNSASIKDLDGHGTHCTSILAKLAPNAEIFVARVFRKSWADNSSVEIVAKAIQHAVNVWNVNIITLSLGFKEDDDDLQREIRRASADDRLIFAAAANNTTNERTPIRFPARMREVISVFSSDGHGNPSRFNPPARIDRPNFMFPGEKVEGAWPSDIPAEGTFKRGESVYKYQDGTSCATPIAAAVAAGTLEFAWQKRAYKIRRLSRLKHYSGMSDIFLKRMVDQPVVYNMYHYVKPWKLISIYQEKDEIPIHIADTLRHIHG